MAENWKHLYEQMKKMVAMYQDEIVPGLRKQVEELESGSKWIPVTERLPTAFDEFIVMIKGAEAPTTLWYDWCKEHWYQPEMEGGDGRKYEVTHWMPLPEPPKVEAKQDCTYYRGGHCTAQKMMPECDPKSCDRKRQ